MANNILFVGALILQAPKTTLKIFPEKGHDSPCNLVDGKHLPRPVAKNVCVVYTNIVTSSQVKSSGMDVNVTITENRTKIKKNTENSI